VIVMESVLIYEPQTGVLQEGRRALEVRVNFGPALANTESGSSGLAATVTSSPSTSNHRLTRPEGPSQYPQ
jgi:hypothetical protein